MHRPYPYVVLCPITVASKRGYTDLLETSSRQLPTGSSSD